MADNERATVVNISLSGPGRDYDEEVEFLGKPMRVVRVGADGSVDRAVELLNEWAGKADTIGVSGIGDAKTAGTLKGDEGKLAKAMAGTKGARVTDGHRLRDVLQEWTVRFVGGEMPGYFANARVVVLGGANHFRTTRVLHESTENFTFTDPIMEYGIDDLANSYSALEKVLSASEWVVDKIPGSLVHVATAPGRKIIDSKVTGAFKDADVIVGTWEELAQHELPNLHGKAVITNYVDDERIAELKARDVDLILDNVPQPFDFSVNEATLEAMMLAVGGAEEGRLTDDDLLEILQSAEFTPRQIYPNGFRRKSRFAFVLHPLSQEFLLNIGAISAVAKVTPGVAMDGIERIAAHAPPFLYSKVTGITSPTGAETEGWLLSVGGTPKEIMSRDPEFTYKRLLAAADMAKKLGAQIIGLGAFTKVVGDAGVTVAKRAPLPVTTGNSYSASGALWAAHDAVRRMGILEEDKDGRIKGKTMVIGATGAIGSVCARLLALASDELWLVSIEPAKLLALKADIERENPRAKVFVAASPDENIGDMDVIVTATSGAGKKILDIMRVKPGAVITDVARPLDLSAEDVGKRPDVLVIESGEIELPGENIKMGDIGLPDGIVYACLAETVVLALEGRYETFTIGRNIEWEKVKEIYKMGIKHGMKLAAISGVNGVYSDEDIAKKRELALAELEKRTAAAK